MAAFNDVTGVILAGGQSQRMGKDKATLKIDGIPLYRRMLDVMQSLFPKVMIAGERPDLAQPGIDWHADIFPGSSLGGLYTGLFHAETPYIFAAACDMPYPDPDMIRQLLGFRQDFDVVVPKTPEGLEPLFACYSRSCLDAMRRLLEAHRYRIYDFYDQVRVRYVADDELPQGWRRALHNVNTPKDMDGSKEESS